MKKEILDNLKKKYKVSKDMSLREGLHEFNKEKTKSKTGITIMSVEPVTDEMVGKMFKEKTSLSEKIQDIVRKIGMKQAKEEQNKILEKYNLKGLNKEQIQGVAELIRYVVKGHNENFKEKIKRLKEDENMGERQRNAINKIFRDKLI